MLARKFIRLIVAVIVRMTSKLKVTGLENATSMEGGVMVVSNHLGRLDAFMIYYLLPREDLIVMAAEKYERYAFARWIAEKTDGIFVDRYNADFRALRQVLRRLSAGGMLVMAPEGTRSHTRSLLEARPGAPYLAAKTGVPVVPAAIVGSEDEKVFASWRRLRRAELDIRVGPPFTLPPLPKKDKETAVGAYAEEMMCRIAALLPEEYHGFYAGNPRIAEIRNGKVKEHVR